MQAKARVRRLLMLGLCFQTTQSAVRAQAIAASSGGVAPTHAQDPLNMTREALFEAVFKRPPPRMPVNSYVFLLVDGVRRGKIRVCFSQDHQDFRAEGPPILSSLSRTLQPEILDRLRKRLDDDGWLGRRALDEEGLKTSFDLRKFVFSIETTPDIRATQTHHMTAQMPDPFSAEAIRPAARSGFLNVSGKWTERTGDAWHQGGQTPQVLGFDVNGALNVKGVVVEGSAFGDNNGAGTFRRGDLRMVYDQPERAVRYSLGDLRYPVIGYQSVVNMGGIGISKDVSLQPHVRAYRTGQFEFYLERPAEVNVWVNDSLVRTLQLVAGPHDIRGFAPDAGQNDVRLEIEDASGRKHVLEFSFIHDRRLLDKGRTLFSYNAGLRREIRDGIYRYDEEKPIVSASYLKGVTDTLTLGAYTQADPSRALLGLEATRAFAAGTLLVDTATSVAEDAAWDIGMKVGFTRTSGARDRAKTAWQTYVEYRGGDFVTIDEPSSTQRDAVNCLAAFQFPVGYGLVGRLSGRYAFVRGHDLVDGYEGSATLRRKWGKYLNTSATLRHGRDENNETGTEFLFGVSFYYSAGDHDVRAAREPEGDLNVGWNYGRSSRLATPTASASTRIGSDRQEYAGSVGYKGNHGMVDVSHTRTDTDQSGAAYAENETAVVLQTTLVFADGALALSRPVRENFVIVQGEKGLKNVEMRVDPDGSGGYRARSDWLGPAVCTDLPTYRLQGMKIEPVNPPLGATPNRTTFSLFPTYKSGILLKLGQDAKMVAIGRLVDERQNPLAHMPIEIRCIDSANEEPIPTFTGRNGRFQMPDIKPGRYTIYPAPSARWQNVTVEIPETQDGLYRLGNVVVPTR